MTPDLERAMIAMRAFIEGNEFDCSDDMYKNFSAVLDALELAIEQRNS